MFFVMLAFAMMAAEVTAIVHDHHTRPRPAQSWDQANLKAHDVGCPTAIFIAPNGVLTQCT